MIIWPQRPVDVSEPDLVAAVDALGVDGEKHLDAVPCPLCDLGSWHASVEPQRDAAAPASTTARPMASRRVRRSPEGCHSDQGRNDAAHCPGWPLQRQGHPKIVSKTASQKRSSGPTLERRSLGQPSGPSARPGQRPGPIGARRTSVSLHYLTIAGGVAANCQGPGAERSRRRRISRRPGSLPSVRLVPRCPPSGRGRYRCT